MWNDGKRAVHTIYRNLPRTESFEEELLQFLDSGYTVIGSGLSDNWVYAIVVKDLTDVPKESAKP